MIMIMIMIIISSWAQKLEMMSTYIILCNLGGCRMTGLDLKL